MLARLISPDEYGVVALVTIFITLLNVFVTFGINTALIQKKDSDDLDLSTGLIANMVLGAILYVILFLISPWIASFYDMNEMIPMIKVLALSIPINAINSIQQTYVAKKMMFKKFFLATIIGTMISAFIGISMAYRGYGAWALIFQSLSNTAIDTIVLGVIIEWRPKFEYSGRRASHIYKFGIEILLAQIIVSTYSELKGLIIGKIYTSRQLSYFNKGRQLPMMIETNFDLSIASVLFFPFAQQQDDHKGLRRLLSDTIQITTFISFPILTGLFAVSDNLITVLLTSKWNGCVIFLKIMSISYFFYGVDSLLTIVVRSLGKGKENILIEIFHKLSMLIVMFVTARINIYVFVCTEIVATMFHLFMVLCILKRSIGYGIKKLILDVIKNLIASVLMSWGVMSVSYLDLNLCLELLIQIFFGMILYLIISIILKNNTVTYVMETIRLQLSRL